ncbi:VOC family protein [Leucobacter chromiireducens]|uniref:VOC family protein n=1 Tax=Leucobacter chromiireducens subsp. solipictus TaxID=398235 RepID=A0ABS1SHV3_9MICO|nr:VOC family protein [Leucobacter chromiireducens]MBL3680123.1 VOC family protein [Leucobacter chromiireducens subsp. solipictus]
MAVTGTVARLGHVGIAVADLDRSVCFYTEVLGMRLTEIFDYGEGRAGHGVAVLAGAFVRGAEDTIHHRLSIFTLRDPDAPVPGARTLGLHHIAFELDTQEDLVLMYRRFRADGIPIVNARIGGPGNHARFYGLDPDGNVLEFYWHIDHVGWNGVPHAYPPIQEVELDDFDFAEYERLRTSLDDERWRSFDASTLRASASGGKA